MPNDERAINAQMMHSCHHMQIQFSHAAAAAAGGGGGWLSPTETIPLAVGAQCRLEM
jgi:hypothetical protein